MTPLMPRVGERTSASCDAGPVRVSRWLRADEDLGVSRCPSRGGPRTGRRKIISGGGRRRPWLRPQQDDFFCRSSPRVGPRLASTPRPRRGSRDWRNGRGRADTLMSCFADGVATVSHAVEPTRSSKKFPRGRGRLQELDLARRRRALGLGSARSASLSLLFATSTRLTCASAWSAICAISSARYCVRSVMS